MIRLNQLSKSVGNFRLSDITLNLDRGTYTVLLGDSGSGKSLLLEILAGIRRADSGTLSVNGVEIQDLPPGKRPFGIVFQDLALFPHLTVFENIEYPLRMAGMEKEDRRKRVTELAGRFSIEAHLKRFPTNLSGGEKQRVALARTLAPAPECLLLDEPLTALDARIRKEIKGLLRSLNREGLTIIHVTHDYHEALELASHIGILENGRLIHFDEAAEVLRKPVNAFAATFSGIRNFLKVQLGADPDSGRSIAITENGSRIVIETRRPHGNGYLIIPEEAIFLSAAPVDTSAANSFPGVITDLIPAPHGTEVIIDAGFPLCALVTPESLARLNLTVGTPIWASFKATALRLIRK